MEEQRERQLIEPETSGLTIQLYAPWNDEVLSRCPLPVSAKLKYEILVVTAQFLHCWLMLATDHSARLQTPRTSATEIYCRNFPSPN